MELFQISVFEGVLSGLILAAIIGLWAIMRRFVKDQRAVNEANRNFIRSQQRAEIVRYFRIVVEQGQPITIEEMDHITSCYASYSANGGNGTGKLMYERIQEFACIATCAPKKKGDES